MGLDITWHRGLTRAQGKDGLTNDGETDYDGGWEDIYDNPEFPGRADDVPRGRYKAEESDGFSAGSYMGYSQWREQLAKLAGFPAADPREYDNDDARSRAETHPHSVSAWDDSDATRNLPFYELVNFSDCEGTIGTAVSKELAADFAAFQAEADAHSSEWFRRKYAEWRNAFGKASDRGAVCFH